MIDEDKAEADCAALLAAGWPPELAYLGAYCGLDKNRPPVTIRLTYGPEYVVHDFGFSDESKDWIQCVRVGDGRYIEVRAAHISYVVCSEETTSSYRTPT